MKVAVTGSSGLIGTALVAGLRADGHEVLRLVRGGPAGQDTVTWHPRAERGGLDPGSLDGVAARTRDGQVGPDELAGGTFTLTNTGSRGALFDTPIINQPQVGILGVGSVVKRAVVVEDPALGEVIAVRSMVYLALTYDHRLVDGADAARFLVTVKNRLEEGAFEADLGL